VKAEYARVALIVLAVLLGPGSHQSHPSMILAQEEPASTSPGPLRLYFLNVGQGDAALIVTPDGVTALVDGGDTDRGDGLVTWVRSMGIESIDWVMPSHPHIDHIAGLTTVLQQLPVRNALVSDQENTTVASRRQMQVIAEKNVPLTRATEEVRLQLGAYVTAQVLNPPALLMQTLEPIEDNSVLLRVCIVAVCALFTGDIGDQGEQRLAARYADTSDVLRSQILKVSHHGSAEPNNLALLALIKPEVATISSGAGNPFGHPTQRAIDRLTAAGATIYRTDTQGTILVEMSEDRYVVTPLPDVAIASSRPTTATPESTAVPQPGVAEGTDDFDLVISVRATVTTVVISAARPTPRPCCAPIRAIRTRLDPDRDGIACETRPAPRDPVRVPR
jgi:competence protein ComEC